MRSKSGFEWWVITKILKLHYVNDADEFLPFHEENIDAIIRCLSDVEQIIQLNILFIIRWIPNYYRLLVGFVPPSQIIVMNRCGTLHQFDY